jgi:4-diphosphocytidyl-2-C-methyl-D-erythritol kinase
VPAALVTRAPAKINLTLHVLGRRADGYHELESLVAFAAAGDVLSLTPGLSLGLVASGPTAALAGPDSDNLVLEAARLLAERFEGLRLGRFHLVKRLPVAAGIGGGSSDAAAALRLLARLNGLSLGDPRLRDAARCAGSDVPVCLDPRARLMRGAGEDIGPVLALPRLHAVLVNPGVPVATPSVFKRLGLEPGERLRGEPHPAMGKGSEVHQVLKAIRSARNDLEPPARLVQPVIGEALSCLAATRACRLARMSGSGATVFGLYDDGDAAAAAAKIVKQAEPSWWVKPTTLR